MFVFLQPGNALCKPDRKRQRGATDFCLKLFIIREHKVFFCLGSAVKLASIVHHDCQNRRAVAVPAATIEFRVQTNKTFADFAFSQSAMIARDPAAARHGAVKACRVTSQAPNEFCTRVHRTKCSDHAEIIFLFAKV